MTDTGDPQDLAEALDSDKLPGSSEGPDVEADFPLEETLGAEDFGVTPAEEQVGEPVQEREDRYEPDPLAEELDAAEAAPRSVDEELEEIEVSLDPDVRTEIERVDGAVGELLDEGVEEPVEPGNPLEPVGRLVDDVADGDLGPGFVDEEPDAVASAVEEEDLSAEEEAVHLTADPPMGSPGDGYVD